MDEDWLRRNANKILNALLIMGTVALIMICTGVLSMMTGVE